MYFLFVVLFIDFTFPILTGHNNNKFFDCNPSHFIQHTSSSMSNTLDIVVFDPLFRFRFLTCLKIDDQKFTFIFSDTVNRPAIHQLVRE